MRRTTELSAASLPVKEEERELGERERKGQGERMTEGSLVKTEGEREEISSEGRK